MSTRATPALQVKFVIHFTNVPMRFTIMISGGLFRAAYYGAIGISDIDKLVSRNFVFV
jgi:hypothetical protein